MLSLHCLSLANPEIRIASPSSTLWFILLMRVSNRGIIWWGGLRDIRTFRISRIKIESRIGFILFHRRKHRYIMNPYLQLFLLHLSLPTCSSHFHACRSHKLISVNFKQWVVSSIIQKWYFCLLAIHSVSFVLGAFDCLILNGFLSWRLLWLMVGSKEVRNIRLEHWVIFGVK